MNEEKVVEFILAYTKGIDLMNCAGFAMANNFEEPEEYSSYGCAITFLDREKCSVQSAEDLQQWHGLHHKGHVSADAGPLEAFSYAFPPPFNFVGKDDVDVELVSGELAEVEVSTGNGSYKYKVAPSKDHPLGLVITSGEVVLPWGAGTSNLFEEA